MASLPQSGSGSERQQSQQPTPPTPESSASDLLIPTPSENSSPLLDTSSESFSQYEPSAETQETPRHTGKRPRPRASASSKEPRRCWICLQNETEDSPTSSRWRSPCPCALTAHESCLLDWIADLEAPKRDQVVSERTEIQCPQCKSNITVRRPQNVVVDSMASLESLSNKLVYPVIGVWVVGSVTALFWIHGLSTIYIVFGQEDAKRILGFNPDTGINTTLATCLPIIPAALIASRGMWANYLLRFLPLMYFASGQLRPQNTLWPPTPGLTIAFLPYIRSIYYIMWRKLFHKKEEAWAKEIQPRLGEEEHDNGREEDHAGNAQEGEGVNIEVGIGIELGMGGQLAADMERARPQGENPPVQGAGRQDPVGNNQNRARPRQFNVSLTEFLSLVTKTVTGALLFPAISVAMGGLLKASLPHTWTMPQRRSPFYFAGLQQRTADQPGFLQTRFGRTIAGGCLFIVLKDSLVLYSKYQLAQTHRQRSIVNYDRKKKRPGQA